ncbi:hypothetical protein ABIF83_001857 [Bradyrhizobium ottawaense]
MAYPRPSRPLPKGRFAIVTRCGPGGGGRGSAGAAQHDDRAGNRESSGDAIRHGAVTAVSSMPGGEHTQAFRVFRRDRPRTEKSCGPDARGLCVKACGDAAARPGTRIDHPQGDGGNSASLPGESTKDTVKTSRAGKAGRPASPVVHPVCIFVAHGLAGAAGARPSLRPLVFKERERQQASGETRRESAKACLHHILGVIADSVTWSGLQPHTPLLRASQPPRLSCPGRSAAPLSGALQSRGPCRSGARAALGPGSAQQRKNAAARPGHVCGYHRLSHHFSRAPGW